MIEQFHSWVHIWRKPKTLIWKDICTPKFIAALFIIAKIWKPVSINEWIKNTWHIYSMEYYLVIKKKEILSFVTTWMNSEGIMLNGKSQTEKDKCYVVSLTCAILKKKKKKWTNRNRIEGSLPGSGRWGKQENVGQTYKLSLLRRIWISSEDPMYNMVTVVNNTVLYTWNLLKQTLSILTTKKTKNKNKGMGVEGNYVRWWKC